MLLEIENLHKNFGGASALVGASLCVATGEVVGLVGDNGAGKSTLLKCITGSEAPDAGTIRFEGHLLPIADPAASRSVGIEMIYQDLNLCLQQDSVTNLYLGREILRSCAGLSTPFLDISGMRKAAKIMINELNSDIDIHKPVGDLSGGQQQTVAIARALVSQPKLLIMDEPTAALGVREVQIVLNLIRSLKTKEISIILVSHRLSDIFAVADRVVLMRHGKIIDDAAIQTTSIGKLTEQLLSAPT